MAAADDEDDDLARLEAFLRREFPACVLMPARGGGKVPLGAHKDGQYTWDKWRASGARSVREGAQGADGCVIRLAEGLIVVDVDDAEAAEAIEANEEAFARTVACRTRKGRHFYFRRTPACDAAGMFDRVRAFGSAAPVDLKSCSGDPAKCPGNISVPPSPGKEWLRAPWECALLEIPESFVRVFREHCEKSTTSSGRQRPPTQQRQKHDLAEVRQLVAMLDPAQFEDYGSWMRLGWCLHNIDCVELLEDWVAFSRRSPKFTEGECEKKWRDMRDEGLGIGSLHMWARRDSPYEHKTLVNSRVLEDVRACNGSHNAVAAIAGKLLRGRFVWVCGKTWYEFCDSLWKEDREAVHLRHELSTTVREQFLFSLHRLSSSRGGPDSLERQSEVSDASTSTTLNAERAASEKVLGVAFKLQDANFKDSVLKEMREYFADPDFLRKLDAQADLLAFANGVYDLRRGAFRPAQPSDYVSLSTGFPFLAPEECGYHEALRPLVAAYFEKLHPDPEQRGYVLRTVARQLLGDSGCELFHVHAGFQGAAGNGKTKFFEVLELCLGDYVRKFPVSLLTAKVREEAGKPAPEYQYWRGRRILYCTEPKDDDTLHSGIMKDLTGGEQILYRLLFSNEVHVFRPQYKMHIMCNGAPRVDGADEGVRRRIRKVDYISRFVDAGAVDEGRHRYARDPTFFDRLKVDLSLRMAVLHHLLEHFDIDYEFQMPAVVAENSRVYLDDNNAVCKFVHEFIAEDRAACFSLAEAKQLFRACEFFDNRALSSFKRELEKLLGATCVDQKKVAGKNTRNVFCGFRLGALEDAQ